MKEPGKAVLIAGGAFGLLALAVGLATRTKPSSNGSNKDTGTGALPESRPITRDSCIECVEKHLGAAWVLCAEERDGYPYRLRVIGHLHEAEDESQAWPELHEAIRQARKNYQQSNQVPNFDSLSQIAGRISR